MLSVTMKTTPAPSISNAPTISVRLRPIRSAEVVSQSEIPASPTSVRVKSKPICCSGRPTWRDKARG